MILVYGLLTVLVITSTAAQRIKGGPRIIQEPALVQGIGGGPHVVVGKGGGGGTVHHTEVVQDPISGNPVVVESLGGGGIKSAGLGGLGGFGRRIYRVGQSQIPYGLLGSDYYSYPQSLLTAPRALRRKTIVSDNLSGLGPVGSTIISDPSGSHFTVGDAQIKTNVFGARRLIYRSGISSIPYGLSGSDYYSYPTQLLTQRRLADNLGQTHILTDGSGFTAGDSQIRGPIIDDIGQEKVTIVESDPLGGVQKVTTVHNAGGLGGLRGGNILLRGPRVLGGIRRVKSTPIVATGLGAPIGGFGQRQVAITKSAPAPVQVVHAAPAPVRIVQAAPAPVRVVQAAPAPVRIVQAAPAPVRIVQAAPAPVRIVQARPAPVRIVQAAPAPVRIVQAPAPVRVVQAPAPVRVVHAAPAPVQVVQAPVQRILTQRPGDVFLSQISRPRIATIARPAPIATGFGNIQFTLGGNQLIGGPIVAAPAPVLAAAPRTVIASAPRAIVAAPAPIIATRPQVLSQVKTDVGLRSSIFGNRAPQLVYVDGGRRFPGIDIIGGSRIGDPRLGYTTLPISTSRFANLGLSQASIEAGPTLLAPASPVIGLRKGGSPSQVVTQEEVIGPAGDSKIITTIHETDSNSIIPSKIGGLSSGGIAGIARTSPTKVVTQEEVVGPAGDPQIITTVTHADGPTKIGGLASGGLAGIGHAAPSNVVTQEEVVGPLGDRQVVTTVHESQPSKIGGLASGGLAGIGHVSQDPIQTILHDPIGSGHTQVHIDDGLGSGGAITQVKETLVTEPLTGEVHKVTEVTKSGGDLSQQNIADAIVQESISSGLGGSGGFRFRPRVSFLSQHPYDTPDSALLRSVLTRPVIQQQQVEQIHV